MVGQRFEHVGNRHFEDNVHAAFEVKSQTNLGFQAFLIRINPEILHRILVILLCNRVFELCSLAVIVACGKRE